LFGRDRDTRGDWGQLDADARGQAAVAVASVDDPDNDLSEVVGARGLGGGLAHLLDGRQEQADQDGDDGDHHQQLDQGERGTTPAAQMHGSLLARAR
jgi:hypothetical protein